MLYRLHVTIITMFLMAFSPETVLANNAPYNNYYEGPVHYTSYIRSIYREYDGYDVNVSNEFTDAFSGTFNFPRDRDVGVVKFNDQVINFWEISRDFYEELFPAEKNLSKDRRFYQNECRISGCAGEEMFLVVVSPNSMSLLVKTWPDENDNLMHVFEFRPTRFMICQKIAETKQKLNTQVFTDIFKTLLLAGVQSYTEYQTYQGIGNVYGNNGHFGYSERGTYRDYSWAGARASDALNTLFSGSANASDLDRAWNSLNCF